MCGIAGYIGDRNAPDILFDMLKRLEYRGYDSAGIACLAEDIVCISKDKGRVYELEDKSKTENIKSTLGIAHTRWATHGEPSYLNSHPHTDCLKEISVVHNGIIENHIHLREELIKKGHTFTSETDTEVIPHLIEDNLPGDFEDAFINALGKLRGSFAVACVYRGEPGKIFIARKDSPLVIGLGVGCNLVASDMPALIPYTKKAIILDDFEYAIIEKNEILVKDILSGEEIDKEIHEIQWDVEEAEKSGFKHFMLKEIHEEPGSVKNALKAEEVIKDVAEKLTGYERIYLVACGTAFYASLIGKYTLERFGIASEAVLGSEFRYSTINAVDSKCAVIAVSQSGETADTLASVKEAKKAGAYITSIVNVVGSSLTRVAHDNIYTYSGPEIAVASTKAYVGQAASLIMLSLLLARKKNKISEEYLAQVIDNLAGVPDKIRLILNSSDKIKAKAEELSEKKIFFYIGRRQNYPTALEGALKIKEISYVHAEAYAAGELKHGPLALLEKGVPVIAIIPNDGILEKMESNISEAEARNATVIRVSEGGDLDVPPVDPLLSPLLYITPLHLFAYFVSVGRGIDPDKPRNLAKSVTVE